MTLKMWSRVICLTGTGLEHARCASTVLVVIAKSLRTLLVNPVSDCFSGLRYQGAKVHQVEKGGISVFIRFAIDSMCYACVACVLHEITPAATCTIGVLPWVCIDDLSFRVWRRECPISPSDSVYFVFCPFAFVGQIFLQ
jgi:hypothetical protein